MIDALELDVAISYPFGVIGVQLHEKGFDRVALFFYLFTSFLDIFFDFIGMLNKIVRKTIVLAYLEYSSFVIDSLSTAK